MSSHISHRKVGSWAARQHESLNLCCSGLPKTLDHIGASLLSPIGIQYVLLVLPASKNPDQVTEDSVLYSWGVQKFVFFL